MPAQVHPIVQGATLQCAFGSSTCKLVVTRGNANNEVVEGQPLAVVWDTGPDNIPSFGDCAAPTNATKKCEPYSRYILNWDRTLVNFHPSGLEAVPETAQTMCYTYKGIIKILKAGQTTLLVDGTVKCKKCGSPTPCEVEGTFPAQHGSTEAGSQYSCGPRSILLATDQPVTESMQEALTPIYAAVDVTYGNTTNVKLFKAYVEGTLDYPTVQGWLPGEGDKDGTPGDGGFPTEAEEAAFAATLHNGGGAIVGNAKHIMALTDSRSIVASDGKIQYQFLLKDPWAGVSMWVPPGNLRNGNWAGCLSKWGFSPLTGSIGATLLFSPNSPPPSGPKPQ